MGRLEILFGQRPDLTAPTTAALRAGAVTQHTEYLPFGEHTRKSNIARAIILKYNLTGKHFRMAELYLGKGNDSTFYGKRKYIYYYLNSEYRDNDTIVPTRRVCLEIYNDTVNSWFSEMTEGWLKLPGLCPI